ncbi:unnamed protein product, partial [Pylaiella littoralis]
TPTAVRGTPRRAQVLLRPSWGRASKVLATEMTSRADLEENCREFLSKVEQRVQALVQDRDGGLDAVECEGLRTLAWNFADPLRGKPKNPILPGYSGPLAAPSCRDELTGRLLSGANPED